MYLAHIRRSQRSRRWSDLFSLCAASRLQVARLSGLDVKLASQDGWQEGAGVLERITVELVTIADATAVATRATWQKRGLLG